MEFVSICLTIIASLLAVPVAVLCVEIFAALLLAPRRNASSGYVSCARSRVAVLIPAHNEGATIEAAISDIKAQLSKNDRLVVVADNCSDDTSRVAVTAGAEVVDRNDLSQIGKGYALDWGCRHLGKDPPEVLIIIDADCRVAPGSIDRLSSMCQSTGRPVQSLDLMVPPSNSAINFQVAQFAWRVKNWVRPLGLQALNLPCQLMGTGMAFPWTLIGSAKLASSEIVEDIKLGLDLAAAGNPPLFCPDALVTSQFPSSKTAATIQRQRWEQGNIRLIAKFAPRLIWLAFVRRQISLLALALDLAVPPLILLWILTTSVVIISGVLFVFGLSFVPFVLSAASFVLLMGTIFLAWLRYGAEILPARAFPALVIFMFAKFGLYRKMIFRGIVNWVPTDRDRL